jgi:hypothetical protein
MNAKEGRVTLSSLYDRIEIQLRALETLGLAINKYAAMFFPLVETGFQRRPSEHGRGMSTLDFIVS